MKKKLPDLHTSIKLTTSFVIFYILMAFSIASFSNPVLWDAPSTPRIITIIYLFLAKTSPFLLFPVSAALMTANIMWAEKKKNRYLLFVGPLVTFGIIIVLSILLLPYSISPDFTKYEVLIEP